MSNETASITVPTSLKVASWAFKNKVALAVTSLALAFTGYQGVSYVSKSFAKDVNAAGKKEVVSFTVQSGKEFPSGIVLNSSTNFKDPGNKAVWVTDKALLPGGLQGTIGKKIHVFTEMKEVTKDGRTYRDHPVTSKDDITIE